jgi:CRISPR-associated protein Csd2
MSDIKTLTNKIDFAVIILVNRANPNRRSVNGNARQTYDGFGEISDVCLKRKIRNRLQDMGESIFVQSDDNRASGDEFRSLNDRFKAALGRWKKDVENNKIESADERNNAPKEWFDVRAFGQVFAFKGNKDEVSDAVSIGIRGPVTSRVCVQCRTITPDSLQIVKSVNLETNENEPDKKGSDTMGMKHRVDKGV